MGRNPDKAKPPKTSLEMVPNALLLPSCGLITPVWLLPKRRVEKKRVRQLSDKFQFIRHR